MTTRHAVITQALHEPCTLPGCGATPGQDCKCIPHGIHMCRLCAARDDGYITPGEYADNAPGVFTAATVVPDAWCLVCGTPLDADGSHSTRAGARIRPEVTP